jgi:hypothetical protein
MQRLVGEGSVAFSSHRLASILLTLPSMGVGQDEARETSDAPKIRARKRFDQNRGWIAGFD